MPRDPKKTGFRRQLLDPHARDSRSPSNRQLPPPPGQPRDPLPGQRSPLSSHPLVSSKMASGGGSGGGGVSVPALWSEVNRYGQNGDFTRALKTVNKSECRGGRGRPGDAPPGPRARPLGSAPWGPPRPPAQPPSPAGDRSQPGGHRRTARARLLRATWTSLRARGIRREGEGGLKEPAAPGTASKVLLIPYPPLPDFCGGVRWTLLLLEGSHPDSVVEETC